MVGIATDYCVHATAADAARGGFATRVLLDLTAGVAPESTAKAIEDLRAAGVELTGTVRRRLVAVSGLRMWHRIEKWHLATISRAREGWVHVACAGSRRGGCG